MDTKKYKENIDVINLKRYNASIIRVVDGDTYDAEVDLGFGLKYTIRIRLYQVDTPEVRGEEREFGLEVTNIVRDMIEGQKVVIESTNKQDSFGRWLCYVIVDDQDLGKFLLDNENAEILIMAKPMTPENTGFLNWRTWF